MTDTGRASCTHTRAYRDQKDALHNQLEQAGHAVALTRALRSYLIEESISVAVLAEFIGDALRVDPARVTVGMLPRNGLQIRIDR
jgi:hypothetical protein